MTRLGSAQNAAESQTWAFGQFLDALLPDRRLKKDWFRSLPA